jgi:hypothetical protein
MIDADKREALRVAKARIAEIMAPKRAADRLARKAQRKASASARTHAPMKDQRQPRVRDNAYLAFLRRQPCLKCGKTPSDAAHIRFAPHGSGWRYTGKGEKPDDRRAVPLSRDCHELQHSMSEAHFWSEVLGMDPVQVCADLYAAFLSGKPSVQQALSRWSGAEGDCEYTHNTTEDSI